MASARELLEQADALMQKNRARVDAEIPLLMDAVAHPAQASGATVHADAADVPVLTDIVDDLVVGIVPPPIILPRPSPIAAPRAPLVSFEGDPSDWLVMDTIDPSMHSITGGAPDTLGVVPPFSSKAAGSARTPPPARSSSASPGASLLDPLGLPAEWSVPEAIEQNDAKSEAWPISDAPSSLYDDVMVEAPASAEVFGSEPVAGAAGDVDEASALDTAALRHDVERTHKEAEPAHRNVDPVPSVDDAVGHAAPMPRPIVDSVVVVAANAREDAATVEAFEPTHDVVHAPTSRIEFTQSDETVPAIAATRTTVDAISDADAQATLQRAAQVDEERWHALAEQISMQVLQRVDLFTDTGLKDQLADRLKPIVARASAELVGTIADHVGELLRTYVAEAIEREIAAWRSSQP